MKTIVHTYAFDLTKEAQRKEYAALTEKLIAMGLDKFDAIAAGPNERKFEELPDGLVLELETAHLFNNQWNTGPVAGLSEKGLRVFDWREPMRFSNGIEITSYKNGYWLEQSDEMRTARANRYKCGYCGVQADKPSATFHTGCLDSPYLKEKDLYLLRFRPVTEGLKSPPPLTDTERAELLPLYTEAQLRGTTERGKARAIKLRQDINAKAQRATQDAAMERIGMTWVLDNFGPALVDNVIFYSHTKRFCFGWRSALDESVTSAVLDKISEFPFAYTLKTESRGTLESGPVS